MIFAGMFGPAMSNVLQWLGLRSFVWPSRLSPDSQAWEDAWKENSICQQSMKSVAPMVKLLIGLRPSLP